jgi:outer membrane protein insertion porin family
MRYPVSLNPAATVYVVAFAEAGNLMISHKNYANLTNRTARLA